MSPSPENIKYITLIPPLLGPLVIVVLHNRVQSTPTQSLDSGPTNQQAATPLPTMGLTCSVFLFLAHFATAACHAGTVARHDKQYICWIR
uniref:Uncharacterized protein n=1 Tax=Aegilops tauschii subsp. strangulata TaxID=200361 RepID=A0A453LAU4_AEGTS